MISEGMLYELIREIEAGTVKIPREMGVAEALHEIAAEGGGSFGKKLEDLRKKR